MLNSLPQLDSSGYTRGPDLICPQRYGGNLHVSLTLLWRAAPLKAGYEVPTEHLLTVPILNAAVAFATRCVAIAMLLNLFGPLRSPTTGPGPLIA